MARSRLMPIEKRWRKQQIRRYYSRMNAEEIKALPIGRKIQIMEAIWEDFRDRFDRLELSDAQKNLLDRRRARMREGSAQLLDWESVKRNLRI